MRGENVPKMDPMNRVFLNYLDFFLIVFINDSLAYSKNEGENMDYFRVVLQVHEEHKLFSKYIKCECWF